MSGYLEEKARQVRARRLAQAPRDAALMALREHAGARPPAPRLSRALRGGEKVALIAEFKRRSPSAGPLATGEEAGSVARDYEASGASAISVLTDGPDFDGDIQDLQAAVSGVPIPVLRKDFIVDEAALYESRIFGAAAALLIMRILEGEEPRRLLACAARMDLECLVEVHDERELERALEAGATLIGINNRDLQTLTTDLSVTERLALLIPKGATLVSESGIRTAADVGRVCAAGAHAVLVGEALMRLDPVARRAAVAELAGVRR